MEAKSVVRRRLSAVHTTGVSASPLLKGGDKKIADRYSQGSRVIDLDENGNQITGDSKDTCKESHSGNVRRLFSEARLQTRGNTLLVERQNFSCEAAKFMDSCNKNRNSNLGRYDFLHSFEKTNIRHTNVKADDIKPEDKICLNTATMDSAVEAPWQYVDSFDSERRIQSTGSVLVRPSSTSKTTSSQENLLRLRGSKYTAGLCDIDLTVKIRKQSARRRINRILKAEKEKEEQERLAMEEAEQKRREEERRKRAPTLRSATFAVMAMNVSAAGYNFKSFTEKKKWLAEKRMWTRQIARSKFRWATRMLIILSRILKALMTYSVDLTSETATQKSFRNLRDNTEVKEILFNKSLYQKGKSQYAYVPDWAKKILSKSAMERTENELHQLHSVLKGLTAYDKFTYRIQLAMCRAMTYIKVEHPRVVLRKGHRGLSFYFIFSGSAFVNVEEELVKTGHVTWHTAITLQRGDSFGELALLRNIRRTASVVVREDAELLVVEKDVFSKTCPIIFDKELNDKIKFCRTLPLFDLWQDDALINLCIEAQIQQWKINEIIVKDSGKELNWIYLCMQGKCSVIKVLDLRQVEAKQVHSKRITKEGIYYPKGLVRRKNRFQTDISKIWIKELHKSLENSFSFGENKTVDEHNGYVWSDSESSDDEASGVKRNLKAMDPPSHEHIIDEEEIQQEQATMEAIPSQLEKQDKAFSQDFSDLIKIDSKTGKLNKDVVYLDLASMEKGDIFDVSQLVRPTGRKLMLVSKGTVMMKIKRDDFFRYSTKQTLKQARRVAQELDYPTEEMICRSYNERCTWEQFKSRQLQSTMGSIQERCIRHFISFEQSIPEVKRPLRPARIDCGPSRLERFDQYMSFVYGNQKAGERKYH